jgi:hypothetical protein
LASHRGHLEQAFLQKQAPAGDYQGSKADGSAFFQRPVVPPNLFHAGFTGGQNQRCGISPGEVSANHQDASGKEKEMSDTPETDHLEVQLAQAAMHSHPILWEHSRRMERERDEARDMVEKLTEHGLDLMDANRLLKAKIKRQAERIRKLEGATNHAGGLNK